MRIEILGRPKVITDDGAVLPVTGTKPALLAALLVLWEGRPVGTPLIREFLWGDGAPASGAANIQTYVWRIRRILRRATPGGDARLAYESGAYRLGLAPGECDFLEVVDLRAAAARALCEEDLVRALELFHAALRLWRGDPLPAAGASSSLTLLGESRRTAEIRLTLHEGRLATALALGRHQGTVVELRGLLAEHPLRERLHQLLMCALCLEGDPGAALRAYRDMSLRLRAERGAGPGEGLRRAHRSLLADGSVCPRETLRAVVPQRSAPGLRPLPTGR
ncbi:AfsR/SARP family transcriptional regulator [Streptomyces sp. TRM 70361]|uniref:AfsR/SARP family transcriptional regulator n=1 Tax=Streptomyces sp. TRM 70361 TaxID=3116553 RepID=UPI002E7C04AC|nr:AfsR/SARP family transcriptional regulator [Streptomyces sp. TRM 70361]MEE1940191.1 AfsR/SARP family transcriptional regulator [Streptomyces sp. TRM 70361]